MERICYANVNIVCRICYEIKDDTRPLFLNQGDSSLYDKLVRDAKLNVDINDGGPSSICAQCFDELNAFIKFLNKCVRANEIFQQYKQNIKDSDSSTNLSLNDCVGEKNVEKNFNKSELTRNQKKLTQGDLHQQFKSAPRSSTCHTCQFCCKVFTRRFNFKLHLERHGGGREWRCAACGAAVGSRAQAQAHCGGRERRACPSPACRKSFTSLANLRTHLTTHTGERPHSCGDCGKTFRSKGTLNDHSRTHTGAKPYLCPSCGKRFATNKLSAHMRTHSAERRHACGACARRFASARALRLHARTHGPAVRDHACAACPARYRHRQSLNKHVRARHPQSCAAPAALAPGGTHESTKTGELRLPTQVSKGELDDTGDVFRG